MGLEERPYLVFDKMSCQKIWRSLEGSYHVEMQYEETPDEFHNDKTSQAENRSCNSPYNTSSDTATTHLAIRRLLYDVAKSRNREIRRTIDYPAVEASVKFGAMR